MREIIRATAWSGFVSLVAELGGDPDAILAAAHIDRAWLNEPQRYLPLRAYIDCQEIAAQRLRRPDFGLMLGQRQETNERLGAIAVAILNAPTVREGIEAAARFIHLHSPAYHLTLSPLPRSRFEFLAAEVDMRTPGPAVQNDERMVAAIHRSLEMLGGAAYRPMEVRFRHARVSPMSVYRDVFGVAPLFGQTEMGVALSRELMDTPRPGGNQELRRVAEAYLQSLGAPRSGPFADRVAVIVRGLLAGGACSSADVARALGVHERTLQRRLQAEGVSFEAIKDGARRSMAEALLAQAALPMSQIALMLDYASPSAFTRSCRRWFGAAPSDVRRRLVRPAPVSRKRLDAAVIARRVAARERG